MRALKDGKSGKTILKLPRIYDVTGYRQKLATRVPWRAKKIG